MVFTEFSDQGRVCVFYMQRQHLKKGSISGSMQQEPAPHANYCALVPPTGTSLMKAHSRVSPAPEVLCGLPAPVTMDTACVLRHLRDGMENRSRHSWQLSRRLFSILSTAYLTQKPTETCPLSGEGWRVLRALFPSVITTLAAVI